MAVIGNPAMALAPNVESRLSQQFVSSVGSVPISYPIVRKVSAAIVESYDPSSCVSFVKYRRPDLDVPWGTPKLYAATHGLLDEPFVGAVGIASEGPVWHTWFVESIASGSMLISEVNFLGDFLSTRSMPLDSELILGFR